jgi:CheY-specific phosphatase CheX
MNQEAMMNAMKTSIFKVLEQMFFLPINLYETDKDEIQGARNKRITSSVLFEGTPSGRFILSMPETLAVSISADFLGVRQDAISSEYVNGTVQEMINMLAGNTLMAFDPQALFNLQIPCVVEKDQLQSILDEYRLYWSVGIETLQSRMTLTLAS